MNIFFKLAAFAAIGSMSMSIPLESADAQRSRGSNTVKIPKKQPNHRAIKAAMRPFGRQGTTAYRNLKAAYRSETRNRQIKLQAEANYGAARDQYRANRSVENRNQMNAAYQNYASRKLQHDNALNVYRSAKDQVDSVAGNRNLAMGQARSRTGAQARPPRRGQPRVNPQRRVATQRQGVSMVQSPRQLLNRGPMVVRNPSPIMIRPNPSAFPAGANPGTRPTQPLGNVSLGQNPYRRLPLSPAPIYDVVPQLQPSPQYTPAPLRQNQYDSPSSPL